MLIVFDAVCRHRNMSHAAEHIHVSQPAISRYMKELRAITGVELFVKTSTGIAITEEGYELWQKTVQILNACEDITRYAKDPFDPRTDKRHFTVAASLLNTSFFVEEIVLRTREKYSNIHIDLIHLNLEQALQKLQTREIAAYLGYNANKLPSGIQSKAVMDVEFTAICSARCPLSNDGVVTKDAFITLPHIRVNTESGETLMDRELRRLGLFQKTITDVPDMASMQVMLRKTDMLFIAQKEHADHLCREYDDVCILKPADFALPQTKTFLLWSESSDSSPPHLWLRDHICNQLTALKNFSG